MYFPDNIIASWNAGQALYAVREAESVAFYVQDGEWEEETCRPLKNVKGWVSPDEVEVDRRSHFYQMLRPVFCSDRLSLIFALFVTKIYGEVRGRAVGYLENREVCIQFLPEVGDPFLIQKSEAVSIPSYSAIVNLHKDWILRKSELEEEYRLIVRAHGQDLKLINRVIFVKTFTGRRFEIWPEMQESIWSIKSKIEDKLGVPPDQQRLIFQGWQLEDENIITGNANCLADYKVPWESTLHMVLRLSGGGPKLLPFADVDAETIVAFDPGAPSWRTLIPGLNLRGACHNSICEANGQRVWIQKGFGSFNMNKECNISTCPVCDQPATDLNNCGFYRCTFSLYGMTETEEKKERLDVQAPDDKFLTFEDSIGSMQKWRSLTITTKPIQPSFGCTLL